MSPSQKFWKLNETIIRHYTNIGWSIEEIENRNQISAISLPYFLP